MLYSILLYFKAFCSITLQASYTHLQVKTRQTQDGQASSSSSGSVEVQWSGSAGTSPVASNSDTERGLEVECAS